VSEQAAKHGHGEMPSRVSGLVMLGSFRVVSRNMRRVLGRLPVVLGCFLGHRGSPTPGATQRSTARSSAPTYLGSWARPGLDRQERLLGRREFGGVVSAREEMTVDVGGHLDRGVPEGGLARP
jgi:hypothetical protein